MTKTKQHKAKYAEIKQQYNDKYNDLFTECGVFWAFSNEQFADGKAKHPIPEGEKYVSIGAGGYMPKANYDKLTTGTKALDAWQKQELKNIDDEEVILAELNNFEAWHSLDLTDALGALTDMGYTEDQVREVFRKYEHPWVVQGVAQ